MIVLDEQLNDLRIRQAVEHWYKGKVTLITEHRPATLVDDEEVASILHRLKDPTFVTINFNDFWRVIPTHPGYCVVCFKLPSERDQEVPDLLRELLKREEFRTKRQRMGRVISVRDGRVAYYD
jgi:hypothetical protein